MKERFTLSSSQKAGGVKGNQEGKGLQWDDHDAEGSGAALVFMRVWSWQREGFLLMATFSTVKVVSNCVVNIPKEHPHPLNLIQT